VIILGLDPGTAITGYGLIESGRGSELRQIAYGCLRSESGLVMEKRLLKLYDGLRLLLAEYNPDEVAIEQLFFNRNVTTAGPVGQARGVLLLACAQAQLPLAEYTPLEVKLAVAGYGRAEKQQMQYMVTRILQLKETPKPDDAADALAVAIAHAQSRRLARLTGNGK